MGTKTNTLVIVESPAKAKTIEKYLGSGYQVLSSIGHVRDLPKSNTDAVDIEGGFIPKYIVSPGKEKVIAGLRTAAARADQVLLASDPDREGEAIAWHVAELIRDANQNLKRVVFHEITEEAVKEAIAHPRAIDEHLKEAQEARRVLDRLVGYDLSGLIWKKVRYGLSAGRVQSPALRIVMERERQIREFVPEGYFVLTAKTTTTTKTPLTLTCAEKPSAQAEADRIKRLGESHPWMVRDITESEVARLPRAPFTTSTLQQVASTRLGFSPSRTMGAAQKLYEAGHITYMRTDSTTLSAVAQKDLIALVSKEFGNDYVSPRQYKTKSKSAQEAHEAIRPTRAFTKNAGATADQKALYELIWQRTVASQMREARTMRTKISANITDSSGTIPDFEMNGSRIIDEGWLRADPRARGEEVEVPKLTIGEQLTLTHLTVEEKFTQPPSRYTEAGLIKELEKRGIGRPSTYASIMNTITERGYVVKEGRTLIPTATGDVVSTFLEQHFADYISDTFTSEMEDELDEIAEGKRSYKKTLTDFYRPFQATVASKENIDKLTNLGPGPKKFPCPKCGSTMVIKLGKSGTFLSCDRFPDCDGSRLIDGSEVKPEEPIGLHPETNEPIFIMNGKYGPYIQMGVMPEKPRTKSRSKKAVGTDAAPAVKRAPIPPGTDPATITFEQALKFLELPRTLGTHPESGEPIMANTGKFGPYIAHAGDFRSLKGADNPYDITLERALAILKEPKKMRKGEKLLKELGVNPRTRKQISVYESKSGRYLKKGFRRISIPDDIKTDDLTLEVALELLKG
jgi:DNA topoisomerase-1